MSEQRKPQVLAARWVSHSRLFHVEEQRLRVSNGVERTYERLNPGFHGAVMVVPVRADGRLLLVREYGAGVGDYYLSFPKGAVDTEESVLDAANRELMEEVGFGAHRLELLTELTLSPSYMGNRMSVVLARDLDWTDIAELYAITVIPFGFVAAYGHLVGDDCLRCTSNTPR